MRAVASVFIQRHPLFTSDARGAMPGASGGARVSGILTGKGYDPAMFEFDRDGCTNARLKPKHRHGWEPAVQSVSGVGRWQLVR